MLNPEGKSNRVILVSTDSVRAATKRKMVTPMGLSTVHLDEHNGSRAMSSLTNMKEYIGSIIYEAASSARQE